MLEELRAYNQINNPDSFCFYHISNGQTSGGKELAGLICKMIPGAGKYFDRVMKAIITARKIAGSRDKLMGVRRGIADYQVIWRDEALKFGYLEFKYPKRPIQSEQKEFADYCKREGIHHAFIDDPMLGIETLKQWGIVK